MMPSTSNRTRFHSTPARLLLRVDGAIGGAEFGAAAGFYLHKNKGLALPGHQIDFAAS
jgi:hypothetical protein